MKSPWGIRTLRGVRGAAAELDATIAAERDKPNEARPVVHRHRGGILREPVPARPMATDASTRWLRRDRPRTGKCVRARDLRRHVLRHSRASLIASGTRSCSRPSSSALLGHHSVTFTLRSTVPILQGDAEPDEVPDRVGCRPNLWAIRQRLIRADGALQADDRGETRSIQAGLSARRRSIPREGAFDVGAGSYCASPPFPHPLHQVGDEHHHLGSSSMTWKATGATKSRTLLGESGDRRSHIKTNRDPVTIDEHLSQSDPPGPLASIRSHRTRAIVVRQSPAVFGDSSGVRGAPSFWPVASERRVQQVAWQQGGGERARREQRVELLRRSSSSCGRRARPRPGSVRTIRGPAPRSRCGRRVRRGSARASGRSGR